jgi:catechol 2,3-dioxygenase-like lactoylglutathione lyase family enzyme
MGAPAIRHIGIVSLPVSDQERAKAFYVDILGFEVVADAAMGTCAGCRSDRPVGRRR